MKKVVDGSGAVANIAYKFSELASIYPITPSSPMASAVDAYRAKGEKNLLGGKVDVIEMQSEAGAAGTMHGALLAGTLASTFTASQGLLLMIPNMYKIAGEGLPAVMHVASRTVATHALSIFGDHSDVYAVRQTGFAMLSSSSVQEAHDLAAVAHLAAISSSVPFLHFMDGFRTSHELNKVEMLSDKDLARLLDREAINEFRRASLNINRPKSRGMAENEDVYFQSVEARNRDYERALEKVAFYMDKINEIQKTDYKPFNYYGSENAKYVIVAMGSVTSTIKAVVKELNADGHNVGVVTVHLFRPFSRDHLLKVLPKSTRRIAVLDRTKEEGSIGEPLYLDVLAACKSSNIDIYGGRYGLSSKNTTPDQIYSVFSMLEESPKENFTIGINDDVTHTSLDESSFELKKRIKELVVYGYGSDGMVSACKDLLKILGDQEGEYVQGYFEYDSKKSGGVTVSHLRFDKSPIDLPYYPQHPNILVVTMDNYLGKYDVASNIAENGVLIVNTKERFDQLNISAKNRESIVKKNITVFTIDAFEISKRNGLKGKISMVLEAILLKLLGIDEYIEILSKHIEERFKTKGRDVVEANIKCVKEAVIGLEPFKGKLDLGKIDETVSDAIEAINKRAGNSLSVSDLLPYKNGEFPAGLSKYEKRNVASNVPVWNRENCIQCGMCSLVCPHAVIRPFIVEGDEKYAQDGISLIGDVDGKYKYIISVSEADCTGCGACIEVCPGKMGEKALSFGEPDAKRQRLANTLFNFYKNPQVYDKFTVKGSQLETPKFEFSGACAGCGETPYIKLLTQLYGEKLIIANATGCSSIYGGSVPSTPYNIPWANSLFEDNAEFGYGIYRGHKAMRKRIAEIMGDCKDSVSDIAKELFETWLNNMDDHETAKKVREELSKENIPREIRELMDYLEKPCVWMVGGDGWAYDIGFGGIDHILSSNEDVNILVLDTEVYSNTGGQASKSSHAGQVAEFADDGKTTDKKDLFRIAMSYPNVYVASVSLGANMLQTIRALKEASEHRGPSIVIAYATCIEQGLKKGMNCSFREQKLAVDCGYAMLMRYKEGVLYIDSKEPDFSRYKDFLNGEVRYNALTIKSKDRADEMFLENMKYSKERYGYYLNLQKSTSEKKDSD